MAESPSPPRLLVTNNKRAARYELHRRHDSGDRELLSFAAYTTTDRALSIDHVETLLLHRDNNFAAMLMAGLLDDARSWHLEVRSDCSYAVQYVREHPETHDLFES